MNKAGELFYLEQFKRNHPGFPEGDVCPEECPDFLVKAENKTVGIEVTQYFRDGADGSKPPLQQREAIRERVLDEARQVAGQCLLPGAYVFVHFDFNFYCVRSEVRTTAGKLVQLVGVALQASQKEIFLRRGEIEIKGVDAIFIKPIEGKNCIWRAPLASFVPTVTAEKIQSILSGKNARCDDYRSKCDEIWLIIVMDRFRASSFSLLPPLVMDHAYSHKFDSAFLFFYDFDADQKPPYLLQNVGVLPQYEEHGK
ncbi:MAG TPA: hypothetical protein VMF08_03175 [Candidatus Sulfotelmatobacter sp.]|nr:hypothetical protein [Candidatus Sulfotelmatobacter sp.]